MTDDSFMFAVNNSPHEKSGRTTSQIMFWVCVALTPALLWSILIFGWHSLLVIISCVSGCVLAEVLCQHWRGVKITVNDYSAIVTGLLLAAVCPANLPFWAGMLGGFFAIAIGKQAFGGLGYNIWNPALLARAFMQISMPQFMMAGEWPYFSFNQGWFANLFRDFSGSFNSINSQAKLLTTTSDAVTSATTTILSSSYDKTADVVTGATSLNTIHLPAAQVVTDSSGLTSYLPPDSFNPNWSDIFSTWFGLEGGSLGEISAVLLILGGLLLLAKKIISWEIPVIYITTVAVITFIIPHPYIIGESIAYTNWFQGPWLLHLGGGGLMLGAFFMATDLVTSPLMFKGKVIFAFGCGALTVLIRLFSGYPEGVCYSILLMNTLVPLIDSYTKPRVFGTKRLNAHD